MKTDLVSRFSTRAGLSVKNLENALRFFWIDGAGGCVISEQVCNRIDASWLAIQDVYSKKLRKKIKDLHNENILL